uniref:Uncharacterized protein n=1 Tax=Anguilla anguilla TaxID=7936 RepID=A0A0E9US14_ANGAN
MFNTPSSLLVTSTGQGHQRPSFAHQNVIFLFHFPD